MSDLSLAGRRILVVEDEYLVATALAEELADLGVDVVGPAPSVSRALALIHRTPDLDLALLDVNLGGEAVYPVADALSDRGVPIVLVTGYDRDAMPERYQDATTLQKPIGSRAVLEALRQRLP